MNTKTETSSKTDPEDPDAFFVDYSLSLRLEICRIDGAEVQMLGIARRVGPRTPGIHEPQAAVGTAGYRDRSSSNVANTCRILAGAPRFRVSYLFSQKIHNRPANETMRIPPAQACH